MPDEKELWDKVRNKVRRALDLDPLCQEESEKEYKQTKPAGPLPERDIDAILEFVQSFGQSGGMTVEPESEAGQDIEPPSEWVDPVNAQDMDAELMELVNRNRGEQDEETNELLDKLREKELGQGEETNDDAEEDDADGPKDTP